MSLRPRFAYAILSGAKTVELRRMRVSATPGTTIIIYASSPVMSVVGLATLAAVDVALHRHCPDPYSLAWLRDHAQFQPPKSYRFLSDNDPEPLRALIPAGRSTSDDWALPVVIRLTQLRRRVTVDRRRNALAPITAKSLRNKDFWLGLPVPPPTA